MWRMLRRTKHCLLLLGLAASLTLPLSRAEEPAPEPVKRRVTPDQLQSIWKSLGSEDWVERCFAAAETAKCNEMKVMLLLQQRLEKETDARVTGMIYESLATWPGDDLVLLFTAADVDAQLKNFAEAKTRLAHDAALTWLTKMLHIELPDDPRDIAGVWKNTRKKWEEDRAAKLKTYTEQNGTPPLLPADFTQDPAAKTIMRDDVARALANFRKAGLEVALSIEPSSHTQELAECGRGVAQVWKDVSKSFALGLVTINSDGVDVRLDPTDDMDKIAKFTARLSSGSDSNGLPYVPLDRVLEFIEGKFSWDKKTVKHLFVIGNRGVEKVLIAKTVSRIKVATTIGFVVSFFSINQGSESAPRRVDNYDDFARQGGGIDLIIKKDTPVAATLCAGVFGPDAFSHCIDVCDALIRANVEYKRKR